MLLRTSRISYAVGLAIYPWAVMVGAFLLFQIGRAIADDVGPAPITGPLVMVDRALGFGELPSVTLQRWQNDGATWLARVVHITFFVIPVVLGATLSAFGQYRLFARYAHALAAAFALGLFVFVLAPTAPPWFANGAVDMLLIPDPDASIRLRVDPNPFAALPSMHVAVATVSAGVFALRYPRLAPIYPILMACALVYLGEHYLIDAIAGAGIGVVGWRLFRHDYSQSHQPLM